MPPAARVTDAHTCPMVTGVVPHVGGPILPPGHPVTLIGSLPAARVGDLCTCAGPPDTIVKGSPTVLIGNMPAARMGDNTAHGGVIVMGHPTTLIGDAGSGGGGGGGGGAAAGPGAAAAGGAGGAAGPGGGDGGGSEGAIGLIAIAAAALVIAIGVAVARRFGRGKRCRGQAFHEQEKPMSCVLASSRMMIQQMTGEDPGEETLREEAEDAGWYDSVNGSDPWKIPGLLKDHGVKGARAENNLTLDDIDAATSGGQPAMVGLKNPGHRIVVDGVRTNDDGTRTVLVRDPGYADGCREMSEADFLARYNSAAPVIRFD